MEERREYFRKVSLSEARAFQDADAQIDPNVDVIANINLSNRLAEQYADEIRTSYGLTDDEYGDLLFEGIMQRLALAMRTPWSAKHHRSRDLA